MKTDAGKLLAVRDEIEMERESIQKTLADTANQNVMLRDRFRMMEKGHADALGKMEKLQTQRNVLAHGGEGNLHSAQNLEQIEKDLSAAQKQVESMKEMCEIIKDLQVRAAKEELTLTEKLKELDRKKAEIFSEFQANLDEQDLANRLYSVIHTRSENDGEDELVLLDCRTETTVTHRDVGIGVSQVLPVLVHAYADEGKIVAIEQPEIHLHPQLQAELGDVFIESALGKQRNTFILETHSEHLILRIMRRIRETHTGKLPNGRIPVTSKDVSILFVEPDGARSIIREMPLNDLGELVKAWPGGFFEEGLKEVLP